MPLLSPRAADTQVFMQRLEQEHGASVVTTTPTVTYILDFGQVRGWQGGCGRVKRVAQGLEPRNICDLGRSRTMFSG